MTAQAAGPRGLQPATTPENISDSYVKRTAWQRQPARCELHDVYLVHKFLPHCPLSTPNPFETLARLQDAAWRVIGRGVDDPEVSDALAILDAKDRCMACTDRILTHPTVRRLRAGKAVAA
ncbi:MAG: hypothetical protein ACYTFA_16245 [Planctomycetota bacterium]|jgi:hypothetical protein